MESILIVLLTRTYTNKAFLIVNRIELQLKITTEVQIKDSSVNKRIRISVKYFVRVKLVLRVDFRISPSHDLDGAEPVVLDLNFGQTVAEDDSRNPNCVSQCVSDLIIEKG